MIAFILAATLALAWSPEQMIEDYLRANYPWPEIEVQPVQVTRGLPESPPEKILLVKGLPGRTTFLMRFASGESLEYEARVKAFDWVIKNRRPIKRGEIIDDSDIYRTLLSIQQIPKGAVMRKERIVGMRLKSSISANRTLTENLLESAPVIKKNQTIILIYENDRLRITASGVARENGTHGEYITVMNSASKKQLLGKVINEQTVMVGN